MGKVYGYVRVSTAEQNVDRQVIAMRARPRDGFQPVRKISHLFDWAKLLRKFYETQ